MGFAVAVIGVFRTRDDGSGFRASASHPADERSASLLPAWILTAVGLVMLATFRYWRGVEFADWVAIPTATTTLKELYLSDVGRPSLVGNLLVLLAWAGGGVASLAASRVVLYAVWVVGLYALVRRQTTTAISLLVVTPAVLNAVVIARFSELGAYPTHLAAVVLAVFAMSASWSTARRDRAVLIFLGLASLDMPHALTLLAGYAAGRLAQDGWPSPLRWLAGGLLRSEPEPSVALARSTVVLCAALAPVSVVGLTKHAGRGGPSGTEALWFAAGMAVCALLVVPLFQAQRELRPQLIASWVGVAAGVVLAIGRPEAARQLLFLLPVILPLSVLAVGRWRHSSLVIVVVTAVVGFAGYPYALKSAKMPWWETLAFGGVAVVALGASFALPRLRTRLQIPITVFAVYAWGVTCSFRAVNMTLSAVDEHQAYDEVNRALTELDLSVQLPVYTPRFIWYPAVGATADGLLEEGPFSLKRRSIEEMSSVFRQAPDSCTLEAPFLYLQLSVDPRPECFDCEEVFETDEKGRHPHVLLVCR